MEEEEDERRWKEGKMKKDERRWKKRKMGEKKDGRRERWKEKKIQREFFRRPVTKA